MVAGCDGFHGVARHAVPAGDRREYERDYPFAWLGVLAAVAPSTDELIYAFHERGFALHSLRSSAADPPLPPGGPGREIADWPDDRIWRELADPVGRTGVDASGKVRSSRRRITAMRSFVVEPMSWGRLFLAGDAAHIVPPTGAKGLNLAVADVVVLAEALAGVVPER